MLLAAKGNGGVKIHVGHEAKRLYR